MKYKHNFVHLNLTFYNVSVAEDEPVIMHWRWIWTYKGENGGHQYLYLPGDYGYLSLGLLWSYTQTKPLAIEIYSPNGGECGKLIVGKNADQIIGDALGNMTAFIASQYDIYNSSYWCYARRLHIQSDFVFAVCEHYICTIQTIEYKCCKYVLDHLTQEREVNCSKQHHHYRFQAVWWLVPIIIGHILFAYYPLLLIVLGRLVMSARKRRRHAISMEDVSTGVEEAKKIKLVRMSKHGPPITFAKTICEPLSHCKIEGQVISRVIRIVIFNIPLAFTMLRVYLDYLYNDELIKAAVGKGALLSFSSMLAGYEMASQYFLHYFGGPFVALPLWLVFECLLTVVPYNLEKVIEGGLIEFNGKSSFLITLSVESKERLAGVRVANATGYKRLEKTLLSQVLMLLNCRFLKQTFKLFVTRFSKRMVPLLKLLLPSSLLVVTIGFPLLLLYIGFCFIELVISCIYFAFPVVSCFFIFLKAYVKATQELFLPTTGIKRLAGNILTVLVTLCYIYTWYLYCLVFFDAFWFLTKIIMFTYTGVIAFPKLSYGYLILTFMVIYYIFESFKNFQSTYHDLLYISIKACKRVEEELGNEHENASILSNDRLPVDLWKIIVDRHCPKRIQVAHTLFHLFVIVLVLGRSIDLLFRFDKFRDLSLISHVFTVLVICALPKVVKSMCINALTYRQQKRLHKKIKATIRDYIDDAVDNAEPDIYVFYYQNEYDGLVE